MSDTVARTASPTRSGTALEPPRSPLVVTVTAGTSPAPEVRAPLLLRAGRRMLAWPVWAQVLTVYLLSRLVATVVIELVAVTVQNPAGVNDLHPGYGDLAVVWDGQWYEQIATRGYPDGLPLNDSGHVDYNSWAFFPLFPALVRLVMATGLPFVAAATVLNLVTAAGAVLVLRRLLALRGPHAPAAPSWLALLAVACWLSLPAAPVLQVAYTEALASLLLALALLLLVRRRYLAAVPVVLLLGLTRAVAAPLLLVVVWHAAQRWRARGADPLTRPDVVRLAALAAATALSAVLWPAIVGIATGIPDAFLQTQAVWGQRPGQGLFVPWFSWAWGSLGLPGVVLLVGTMAAWVALVLGRHGRWLSAELRVWAVAYPLYLLAVVRPITSMWRFLLLDFPIAAVAASLIARGAFARVEWRRLRWRLASAGVLALVGTTWWVAVLLTRTPWSDSPP
ncbi:MAG TPA: hypothetical protein VFL94_12590 [Actinomycetales bacterium]|nr:hypothetical protein [Actinomycetales bacterium]